MPAADTGLPALGEARDGFATMLDSVIWDWNGTLLDDVDICVDAMNALLLRRNLQPLDRVRHQALFRFPVQSYYEDLGFDFAREGFANVASEYHKAYNERAAGARLHVDARNALDTLRDAGVRQLLLSALVEDSLRAQIEQYGISRYFSAVYGLPDTHAISKVDRGRQLVESESLDPANTTMVGDTVHDAEVADALGVRCLLVATGHQSADHLGTAGCPVFSTIGEVLSVVAA